jgi:acyl carrier protein
METANVFKQVVQHIGEYLETDVTHLRMDSRVASAIPGLDSFKLFEMILYLEDCFGIEFDESIMENIDTMEDLVNYITVLLPEKPEIA